MADADFHSKYTGEQIEEILDGAVLDNRYKQASAMQRARARTNIGATADEMQVVSFALSQELTKDQKAIARKNIGAGSSDIGLVIKGYVNTVDELQEIVGKDGEAYGVGFAYPYDIYIWDSYRDIWVNNGNIRGADGNDGKDGKDGKDGSDATVTVKNITTALGAKPLTTNDALTLEEIAASTDLTGKVPNAQAAKTLNDALRTHISHTYLALRSVYGSGSDPINIDRINNGVGYIYRCGTTTGTFNGTSPTGILGGNAFLLIGFSVVFDSGLVQYGVQLAIGFGSNKIAIRNAPYNVSGGSWGAWRGI